MRLRSEWTMLKASKILAASALSLYMMPAAFGQTAPPTTTAPVTPTPFQQCAESAGVQTGQHPSESQWKEIGPCMKQKREAQRQLCASENNIVLPTEGSGQHLAKADWKTMHKCMKAAGFKKWHHHRHHRHHHHDGQGTGEATGAAPVTPTVPAASGQ